MSTITVQPSTSASSSVTYVVYGTKQGQREGKNRAASFALSMANSGATPEAFVERANRLARAHGRKNVLYSYVLAFHPDEFDVTSQTDLDRVRDVAVKLTERMHSADYLIAVHSDSAGGHAHAHILITNHDNLTGKSLQRYTSWKHGLRQLNDELMSDEGLQVLPDPQEPKPDWDQRRETFAPGGFEQTLGDKVSDSLTDPRSIDQEAFEEVLAEHGVSLAVTNRDGWSYKMRREDNNKIGRRKASALTPEFTAGGAQKIFDHHRQTGLNHGNFGQPTAGQRTAADYGDVGSIDIDIARRREASNEADKDSLRADQLRQDHGRGTDEANSETIDLSAARARLDAVRRGDEEETERDRKFAGKRSRDSQRLEDRDATQRRNRHTVRHQLLHDDAETRGTEREDGPGFG